MIEDNCGPFGMPALDPDWPHGACRAKKTCSAPLKVVEVGTATPCRTPEGLLVNSSVYECEGPERHCFGTLCPHAAGKWGPPALFARTSPVKLEEKAKAWVRDRG